MLDLYDVSFALLVVLGAKQCLHVLDSPINRFSNLLAVWISFYSTYQAANLPLNCDLLRLWLVVGMVDIGG